VWNDESRQKAIQVIEEVYQKEKKWVHQAESEIGTDILKDTSKSWFLAIVDGKPAGVLRLFYDPPLEFPPEFEVTLNEDIDLEKIAKDHRFVEIGRFMIIPEYRRHIRVALNLMRIAIREVVERDYTHFLTDVFEDDPHSPLKFHTRILGFEVVGKHLHGELNRSGTRIILTLNILKAYARVKERRNRMYRMLSSRTRRLLEKKLAARRKTRMPPGL
jgi:hypothetical protein